MRRYQDGHSILGHMTHVLCYQSQFGILQSCHAQELRGVSSQSLERRQQGTKLHHCWQCPLHSTSRYYHPGAYWKTDGVLTHTSWLSSAPQAFFLTCSCLWSHEHVATFTREACDTAMIKMAGQLTSSVLWYAKLNAYHNYWWRDETGQWRKACLS